MKNDHALREHLLGLLEDGHAHLDFAKATADLPVELRAPNRQACRSRRGDWLSTCGSPSGTSSSSASIRTTSHLISPMVTGPGVMPHQVLKRGTRPSRHSVLICGPW